ncbi:MAG: (5-formylfuran-3-yl)methyl phosphate synthase [Gemmataceae bacterium]
MCLALLFWPFRVNFRLSQPGVLFPSATHRSPPPAVLSPPALFRSPPPSWGRGPEIRGKEKGEEHLGPESCGRGPELDGIGPRVPQPGRSICFAKVGLRGSRRCREWIDRWVRLRQSWPSSCAAVAVAYADAADATVSAPDVDEVIVAAYETGAAVLLIDTFQKDGASLFDWLSIPRLREIVGECHQHGLRVALAGSLNARHIEHLLPLKPDWIAVRGAACEAGRGSRICSKKVRELATMIHTS